MRREIIDRDTVNQKREREIQRINSESPQRDQDDFIEKAKNKNENYFVHRFIRSANPLTYSPKSTF